MAGDCQLSRQSARGAE